jgi:alpha-L-rhamnosidase
MLSTLIVVAAPGVPSVPSVQAAADDEPPSPPTTLTVDGLTSPIGLATTDVQFGWHDGDSGRGAVQTAYRLLVASVTVAGPRPGATAVVWDSGRVPSGEQAFVAYGGPPLAPDSVYQWTVQTWGAGASGVPSAFARAGTFETGLADSDWRASWIRRVPADPADASDEYTYARKEVMLGPSPIVRARAYVSGDQQYELYVNGARVGKGEAYSYPDTQYYETLDVTRYLRAGGDNAVGLLYNWQGATKGHPAGAPGAITEVSVLHADGSTELVATDGTWRVLRGAWLPGTQRDQEGDQVDYTENVNGPAQPVGWDQPRFDDSRWAPATVIGPAPTAPWTHLVSVRTRIVEQPVAAVSLTRLPSGAVVADFGKVYAAVPTVAFHHGMAGRVVTMRAGYLLDEPDHSGLVQGQAGQVSTMHGTQHTDMSYSYVQRGGVETFHPFDYLGFRYLQIDDPRENLTPRDVVALTRHSAVPDEHAATFSSSDPTVDSVFELGRRSALFTAQEQFVDTPTREKGPWLWDGFNESQTAMVAFGEQNLTRKSLLEFGQSQGRYWPQGAVNKIYPTGLGALDIAEFTEIFPEWVWQYWMHTGDRSVVAAMYPVLSNLSDYVFRAVDPSTGLVTNLPATDNASPLPVDTRQNVLGVNVFRRAGDVASVLGRPPDEILRQRQRQSALVGAINSRLTRPDGVYVDGLEGNGAQSPQASQPGNTVAIAYGVVPPANETTVAGYVAIQRMASPPRTAGELLESLALAGRDDAVMARITDSKSDGWANILARGGTFTWEVWDPSDANGDSMSHGWGSNVLVEIQQVLLGVRPAAPGYASVDVTPPRAGLLRASGRVPTPRGDMSVSWHRPTGADGTFSLDVSIPPNAAASVRVPAVGLRKVSESGKPIAAAPGVRSATMEGAYAVVQVGAGTYRFRSSPVPTAFVAPATSSSTPAWETAVIIAGIVVVVVVGVVILLLLLLRRRRAAGAG